MAARPTVASLSGGAMVCHCCRGAAAASLSRAPRRVRAPPALALAAHASARLVAPARAPPPAAAVAHWYIGALAHGCIGALAHWCIGVLAHGRADLVQSEAWRAVRELRRHACSRKKWCVCVNAWVRGVQCAGGASSGMEAASDADAADEALAGVPADRLAHIHGPHMSSSWARASATLSYKSPLTSLRRVAAEEVASSPRAACSLSPGEERKRASLS